MKTGFVLLSLLLAVGGSAQNYPQNQFRNPLGIPMQLVANFGELRANHWHMGLDIRTQQRENLPVYAAAAGYISAVSVDANGFGRAIYINHPNGLTTLYAHLNAFEPRLNAWLKSEQYKRQSWAGKWSVPADFFHVAQGDFIAYSGNTGGSQGPHVHFEIRDTQTDKCLNPLLFNFPIPDAVPPTVQRVALYDRTRSVFAQTPRLLPVKKAGATYTLATPVVTVGTNRVSFALGAIDRFTGYTNPNGIYSMRLLVDGVPQIRFVLDSISYDATRYLNAQIDYRFKTGGGAYLQHISQLPGEQSGVYKPEAGDGVVLLPDTAVHAIRIEVADAAGNQSVVAFSVRYNPNFSKTPYLAAAEQFVPREVNVFEQPEFELYTSEAALYDTANATYRQTGAVHQFLSAGIPTHDSVTVRIKVPENLQAAPPDRLVIFSEAGTRQVVEKAKWRDGWVCARFRQFGTFRVLEDVTPPTVNAPGVGDTMDLRRATRLVFNPKDNLKKIRSLRAELDGQWLLLSNDKSLAFIYQFDAYFLPGVHQLAVTVEDMAGNQTRNTWWVRR